MGKCDQQIEARIQNKSSREALEEEWDRRGIKQPFHYALLTNAIASEALGIKPAQHKQIKGLGKSHNLRDNMTPIELTITTLGEQTTSAIAKKKDSKGLIQNMEAAKSGGQVAGDARRSYEQNTGEKVVSSQNYLTAKQRENTTESIDEDINKTMNNLLGISTKE